MLYADKRALETNLKVQLLEIREKELIFYTNNCQNIGTQAAMLAGFAFAGMMQPLPDEPESLRVLFLVSTVSAFGAPATPLCGPSTARQPALTSQRVVLGGPSGSSPQPSRHPSRAPPLPAPQRSGLQLVTVVTTTLLSMLSPGLALRGCAAPTSCLRPFIFAPPFPSGGCQASSTPRRAPCPAPRQRHSCEEPSRTNLWTWKLRLFHSCRRRKPDQGVKH